MSYEGEVLMMCPSDIDFSNTWAVVVSGASWNPCGHMIFCCGSGGADRWYFHVAGQGVREWYGVRAFPKFMRGDSNFKKYLSDNGKHEIRRMDCKISNPAGTYQKLMAYMSNTWYWKVLPHNCATFTRDLIEAGGSIAVKLNCPDQEFEGKVEKTVNDALEAIGRSGRYMQY
jgi:hypothetical protein